MGKEWSIPEKEWFFLINRMINEVFNMLHSFTADLEAIIPVPSSRFRKTPCHAVGKASTREVTFPVFAALMSEIAFGHQYLRKSIKFINVGYQLCPAITVQLAVSICILWRWIIPCDTMSAGIVPR